MKISTLLVSLNILCICSMAAQRKITPSDSFRILGKVKRESSFSLVELDNYLKMPIPDQVIYNHKGEIKDTLKNIKGVLLKTLMVKTELIYDKPKELNEFYFVCIASDGYKAVFSWNEIYNSAIGNNLYIITEIGGRTGNKINERIVLISTSDLMAGRRYIKALEAIHVRRTK